MQVNLHSTDKIVTANGVQCRIWEGVTEKGISCFALIASIASSKDNDCQEFQRDLIEHEAPSAEIEAIPARLIF